MPALLPLAALLLAAPLAGDSLPRVVERQATRAVETDSVPVARARWLRRLVERPEDRGAVLGLATLARLTYDFPAADSLYRVLLGAELAPSWRAGAEIGAARLAIAEARFADADALLAAASTRAVTFGDSSLGAEALIAQVAVLARTRGPVAAESALDRAHQLAPPNDLALEGEWLCTAAGVALAAARPDALELAWRGAEVAGRVPDPRVGAACLGVAAAALSARLGADSAFVVYGEAIRLARAARDRAGLATLLQWRGYERRLVFDLGGAHHDLLEAVREGDASGNRSAVSWALLNLGFLSASVNDVDQGRTFAERAVRQLRGQGDVRGLEVAQQLDAGLALRAGDVDAAERLYDQARVTATQLDAHGDLVWIASALGRLALAHGDDRAAEHWLERARDEARAAHDAAAEAGLAYHFGVLALRRRDYETAGPLFETDVRQGSFHAQFRSRARLAEIAVLRGRVDEGARALRAALDALDSARAQLPEREFRLRVLDATLDHLDVDLGIATVIAALAREGRASDAFELAERRRAQELLEELVRRDALRDRPAGEGGLQGPAFSLAALEEGLASRRSALVLFVTGMGGEPTTVFTATGDGVRAFTAPPIDSLVAQVAAFRDQVEAGAPAPVLGRMVAAALLDSALASLPTDIRVITLVPDHGLFDLPFDALPLPDGQPVVTRYAIGTAPSAGVLVRLWETPRPGGTGRILAMGDPDVAPRDSEASSPEADLLRRAFDQAGGLAPLPAAAREARVAARFGPRSEVRVRRAASEAWLKRAPLREFRVLHFATHALVSDQSISRTGLALAPGGGEDGFLRAEDLAGLGLDADLVVLSACRTARGVPLLGEGVRGLAAPLVEAGARAVVASTWDVPDEPMVAVMRDFYGALARGSTVADALHRAKLAAYERGEPPRVWAALVVYGDGDGRVPLRVPGPLRRYWWLAVLAGLALGAILGVTRLRPQGETMKN